MAPAAGAGTGTPSQAETSRAKIEAEVGARVAAINGRKPCPFFFGELSVGKIPIRKAETKILRFIFI